MVLRECRLLCKLELGNSITREGQGTVEALRMGARLGVGVMIKAGFTGKVTFESSKSCGINSSGG